MKTIEKIFKNTVAGKKNTIVRISYDMMEGQWEMMATTKWMSPQEAKAFVTYMIDVNGFSVDNLYIEGTTWDDLLTPNK